VSGHSKWHNIRIRKQKVDAQKGKLFTRVTREIITAARAGGSDPEANSQLRTAVQRAREAGMPQDNIKRAIQRGTGGIAGGSYEEITYEGYGPGGVAVLVEALTDNRKRTVSELRALFSRAGGNLGESGCVAWMFEPRGVVLLDRSQVDEESLLELALEAGADDMHTGDTSYEIITPPERLESVKQALAQRNLIPESAELAMLAKSTVPVSGKQAEQVLRLMEALEEQDDVQRVHANFDIPDSVLEAAA
jgi:YebC/PmpR family DNA-binding regulatory protein